MKHIFVTLTLFSVLCLTTTNMAAVSSPTTYVDATVTQGPDADEATIDQVIQVLQDALFEAQTNNVSGFPPLKSATVALNTITNRQVTAGVNFIVFSIGTKYE